MGLPALGPVGLGLLSADQPCAGVLFLSPGPAADHPVRAYAAFRQRAVGLGKGIKWLSNLNMGLTIFLLACFLIINVINAAGDESTKGRIHIIVWGLALTAVIAVLLMAGGLAAIQTAMITGALPFSIVLALTGVALIKALVRDGMRIRAGMPPAGKEPAE